MLFPEHFAAELVEELLLNLPDTVILLLDEHGIVLTWPLMAEHLWGITSRNAIGDHIDHITGEPILASFLTNFPPSDEWTCQSREGIKIGLKRWRRGFLLTCKEQDILTSQAHLLDNIGEGFLMLDHDRRYTYVNRHLCAMLKKSPAELLGKNIWDVFPDAVGSATYQLIEDSYRNKKPSIKEDHYGPLELWIEIRLYPTAQGLSMFVSDRSARKRAEQELEDIFSSAPDIICIVGTDRYFKKVNPAMSRLLGFTEAELLQKPIDEFIHPDDLGTSRKRMELFQIGELTQQYFENRYVRKDGSSVHLGWTASKGEKRGVLYCLAKDISDRKALEARLIQVNKLARIGSWELDVASGGVSWSEMNRDLHEVPPDFKPTKNNILKFYNADVQKELRRLLRYAITYGKPFNLAVEMSTYKGSKLWVRILGETERQNGCVTKIYGSVQDIDARKKVELSLLATLDERDTILESIGDAFFSVDSDFIITYWNKKAALMLGRTKEEMIGKHLWTEFPLAIKMSFYDKYHEVLLTGIAATFEEYYSPIDKWLGISAYPSGNGLSVYFKDISDRRISEIRLNELNGQLKAASIRYEKLFQLSPIPKWVFDTESLAFLDVNEAAVRHYGYSKADFLQMTIKDIRPAEMVDDVVKAASASKSSVGRFQAGNFVHRKKDGSLIEVEIQSNNIEFHGRSARIVTATDVTEKLRYQRAIEEQNRKLQDISWMQSHVIRAPLSRIMGLVEILQNAQADADEIASALSYLKTSADELDQVIRNITDSADLSK